MRCAVAREHMATLTDLRLLAGHPDLAAHLDRCPACAGVWRRHAALLDALTTPPALPEFDDLIPRVLAALDAPKARTAASWQWAAAAALAAAALVLGFLIGTLSQTSPSGVQSMGATYQEALSTVPSGPAEAAYFESGVLPASSRSTP